jgi:uncharacterized protein YidB (DUF937 family)
MLEELLRSALGGITGGNPAGGGAAGGLGGALGSLLGAGTGGGNTGGANALLQLVASLVSNNGQFGGLQGLVQQFQNAGLGEHVNSWISPGQNLPISSQQLGQVFGGGQLQQMAQQVGLDPGQLSGALSQLLPQVVDKLTPNGQVPAGGVTDVLGALTKMLAR